MRSYFGSLSRPLRAAALCAAVLLATPLAACSSTGDGTTHQSSEQTERKGPIGPVPAGLEKFYAQTLTWGDCAPYATTDDARSAFAGDGLQCARLTVPLDYGKPEGDTITLGLLRRQASDQEHRIGSLVMNPGGPGASGMVAAAELVDRIAGDDLGKRFDLVGFDPRGTGASQPQLRCLTDPERDTVRAEDLDTDGTPEGVQKQEAQAKDFAVKCAKATQYGDAMLANIGTRDVAKDLDVLRSALGDAKLTYLGYSYGTRIGSAYAEDFPHNVRALVLDGAVDPQQDALQALVAQGQGFGTAFGEFARWCAARQDCALGRDANGAVTAFQNLTRPLLAAPVPLGDGRKLTYDDATTAAVQALYQQQLWDPLNKGLTELRNGHGETLMALADVYDERDRDGHYSTTQDVFTAVRCVDDPRVTDQQAILKAQQQYLKVAPFLDDGKPPSDARDACAFWPVANTTQPHQPKADGLPPTLVISTTQDPATPYQAGVNLANALKGALLTFNGTQHTAFLQGNACVDRSGVAYLVGGTVPPAGARC